MSRARECNRKTPGELYSLLFGGWAPSLDINHAMLIQSASYTTCIHLHSLPVSKLLACMYLFPLPRISSVPFLIYPHLPSLSLPLYITPKF